ncbi:MAG: STAS domain-containing protein [Phycisphaerales bacterium]
MVPLASDLRGRDKTVLVLRLPSMVTDEQVSIIREEFLSRMPRLSGAGLVMDFSAVELINSIGITCLLQLEEDCRRQKATMLMCQVPAAIAQFFRQLKLDRRFTVIKDIDTAVDSIESQATR